VNVLINDKHHIQLADFGLVSVGEAPASTDTAAGSVHWMSPACLLGASERGPEDDVYAFACIAYMVSLLISADLDI
jgi:serine/threonine protein kinase